jgi:hypothetical protein
MFDRRYVAPGTKTVLHIRYNADTSKFLTPEPLQEYTLTNSSLSLLFRGNTKQKMEEASYGSDGASCAYSCHRRSSGGARFNRSGVVKNTRRTV